MVNERRLTIISFAYDLMDKSNKKEKSMHTNESSENYLETILMLSKTRPVVRSVDIAEELGYKKSSVSVAMKHLREREHITVTKEGFIYLTPSGKEIAEMIYERHQLLTNWLVHLGVDEKIASEDACRIEHDISKESFEAIKKFINLD
jgi:Mn-dependent DtxR family transcriptional regulator